VDAEQKAARPRDEEQEAVEREAKKRHLESEVVALRDAGTKAFASGDNHKAVQLWTHGLALDDGNAPLYSSRSAAYFELENLEQSMADANKCIDLAPKWCKGYYRKAKVLFAGKNLAGALSVCRKGLEVAADDPQLKALGDQIRPQAVKEAEGHKEKGNVSFQAKDYEAAIAWYQKALHLDPENHILYSNRSACYCALEEYEKALKDANKCIKLNKLFLKGYSRKSSAMQGLGQKADALKALRQGLKEAEGVDGMRKQREALQDTLNELEEAVHGKPPEAPKQFWQPLCRECFQEGHLARDCPKKKSAPPMGPVGDKTCRNCGGTGHLIKDCPLPKTTYCRGCGAAGHTMRDCPNPSTPMDYGEPST
jgi:tetratricopeptide (TPR) repeat protein